MDKLPDELWSSDQTSTFLSVPVATLYAWNHRGTGPRFYVVGRHRRYDPRDVLKWLEAHASPSAGGRVA